MTAFFIVLRGLTGMAALVSLSLIGLVVFVRESAALAKQGLQVLGYVTTLFATAFTEGTAPKEAEWQMSPMQIMIGVLSLVMLISVFTPETRWFLHLIGALAVIVMFGFSRMFFTETSLEIICLPFISIWFGYYAMCLFWKAPVITR
jgi:hypothetical protein